MQSTELSLAGKLDNGLTKGLCLLLRGLKTACLWLAGLLTLASLPLLIFEYGEGLADLSLLEWAFMPLLVLLLWRHIHYCQHFAMGFWRGLSCLLIAQGIMAALSMVLFGAYAAWLAQTEHPDEILRLLTQEDPLDKLLAFGMVLLALYLAIPKSASNTLLQPATVHARVEPEIFTPAKEASL
ncbi:hypothetical protein [Pseudomonas sp.]|uniref:hypothetical protein n=1 Tax=Pseudomonas sp. TaxID=306 RepID=UPI00273077EE|nr:hypothetical protein [Pseudomonas sp.]MDP2243422.1 hypothetical protein [Pseudomonas sp.]